MSELVIFKDKELKTPLRVCDFIEVEIGESKSIECYIYNESDSYAIQAIKEVNGDDDLSVVNVPQTLQPKESKPIVITFKPSIDRRTPLTDNISFTGKMVIQ